MSDKSSREKGILPAHPKKRISSACKLLVILLIYQYYNAYIFIIDAKFFIKSKNKFQLESIHISDIFLNNPKPIMGAVFGVIWIDCLMSLLSITFVYLMNNMQKRTVPLTTKHAMHAKSKPVVASMFHYSMYARDIGPPQPNNK